MLQQADNKQILTPLRSNHKAAVELTSLSPLSAIQENPFQPESPSPQQLCTASAAPDIMEPSTPQVQADQHALHVTNLIATTAGEQAGAGGDRSEGSKVMCAAIDSVTHSLAACTVDECEQGLDVSPLEQLLELCGQPVRV